MHHTIGTLEERNDIKGCYPTHGHARGEPQLCDQFLQTPFFFAIALSECPSGNLQTAVLRKFRKRAEKNVVMLHGCHPTNRYEKTFAMLSWIRPESLGINPVADNDMPPRISGQTIIRRAENFTNHPKRK